MRQVTSADNILLWIRKFSRGFYFREYAKFREIKSSPNGKIILSFTNEG